MYSHSPFDMFLYQGKHFAKFKITTCCPIVLFAYVYCRIGIMRPISSRFKSDANWTTFCPLSTPLFNNFLVERTPEWGESDIHCCLLFSTRHHSSIYPTVHPGSSQPGGGRIEVHHASYEMEQTVLGKYFRI